MNDSAPRIYRAAIWLYPAQFRREFGADLDQAFRDLRHGHGAFSTWRRSGTDLLSSIPAQHLEALMARTSPSAVALTGGALLLAAVVATGAFGYPVMALLPVLIGAGAVVVYRRSHTPYREAVSDSSRLWSWFLGGGLGLLAVIIGAAKLHDNWNWFPWQLLVISIIFGWALIGTGVLLAIVHVVRRASHGPADA